MQEMKKMHQINQQEQQMNIIQEMDQKQAQQEQYMEFTIWQEEHMNM